MSIWASFSRAGDPALAACDLACISCVHVYPSCQRSSVLLKHFAGALFPSASVLSCCSSALSRRQEGQQIERGRQDVLDFNKALDRAVLVCVLCPRLPELLLAALT